MAKLVKCPRCKKENNKDMAVLIPQGARNAYYCPECAEEYRKADNQECGKCGTKQHLSKMVTVNGVIMCATCYKEHKKAIEAQLKKEDVQRAVIMMLVIKVKSSVVNGIVHLVYHKDRKKRTFLYPLMSS